MSSKRQSAIKHSQRESFLHKEIASIISQLVSQEPEFSDMFVNRVILSPDRGMCVIYFHTLSGKEGFKKKLPTLILYKPSIRHAIAQAMQSRYTPEIRFVFDASYDKQRQVDDLIEQLKDEGRL
jgi:ribosome-binding factor A